MTKAKPPSASQRGLLDKAPQEWGNLPDGIGSENRTLAALTLRRLVEMQYVGQPIGWWWRKMPEGVAK